MSISFLLLHLRGRRFQGGSLPLAFLRDLSALEELVIDVAKRRFLAENPTRKRTPRGFRDGVELRITRLSEGSAITAIDIAPDPTRLPFAPRRFQEYFDAARDDILSTIANERMTAEPGSGIDRQSLLYFNHIGSGLHDDETMELESPATGHTATLTRQTRRKLVLIANTSTFSEEVVLRGAISEMDQKQLTFTLRQIHGSQITGPLPETHFDTVLKAFDGYRSGQRVVIDAVGRYDASERLQGWDAIRHVSLLDPLDIPARLDEFRGLRPGWYEGTALAPPADGLDWFATEFESHYPAELPLPWVYPTQQGGIAAEWELGDHKLSLDVDLNERSAEWHWFSEQSEQVSLLDLNLSDSGGWERIVEDVRRFHSQTNAP